MFYRKFATLRNPMFSFIQFNQKIKKEMFQNH